MDYLIGVIITCGGVRPLPPPTPPRNKKKKIKKRKYADDENDDNDEDHDQYHDTSDECMCFSNMLHQLHFYLFS